MYSAGMDRPKGCPANAAHGGSALNTSNQELMTIEAELRVPVATVQIVHFHLVEPIERALREERAYRLDLCLTPRPANARACYSERWAPHRFERIGKVFLLPPGETMRARSECGRQASIVCHLFPDPCGNWLGGDVEWNDRRLAATLDIPDATIRGLLLRLAEELRHPGFASEMLVEHIVAQVAIELGRYCAAITDGASTGALAPWRLRLIDERLKEVQEPPTLAELARLCRLSVRQLTRGFRASRGRSIGDHLAQARLDSAMRQLTTDQSVKAIAYSLGFASPSSFSYAFHRAVGETPRQYRKRVLHMEH
jgi:AraC family transcriptional regulator